MPRWAVVVLPMLLLAGASSGAQEPRRLAQPDSVSRDFALGLVAAGGFATEPQLLVGAMPEWASRLVLLPSGGRVLGSAFIGTTLIGVVSVPARTDSLIPDLMRQHQAHGWTPPPPPPAMSYGGFRPATMAPTRTAQTLRAVLCNGDNMLALALGMSHPTYTIVTYRLSSGGGSSTCHPPVFQRAGVMRQLAVPTLYNPPDPTDGVSGVECSSAMSPNGMGGSGTTLRSTMSASALLDHYGRQLADSGWTSMSADPTTLGRTWTRPDSTGTPIEASLVITSRVNAPSCREVQLMLRSPARP